MGENPADYFYTATHEWVRIELDGTITVGITDHAQCLLGDVVFVEAPEVESHVTQADEIAVIESVKAASDIYAPVTGVIIAINEALSDTPELVNQEPFGQGWLFRMQPDNIGDVQQLLDAHAYTGQIAE